MTEPAGDLRERIAQEIHLHCPARPYGGNCRCTALADAVLPVVEAETARARASCCEDGERTYAEMERHLTQRAKQAERERDQALADIADERRGRLAAEAAVRRVLPAIESVRRGLATTSRDMATDRTDAWLYAVFLGWDCEEEHQHTDDCDAMTEVASQHGWDSVTVARLREYHAAMAALDAEEPR